MRLSYLLIFLSFILPAQPKQILRPQGDRLYATVPLIGSGKWNDPIRPMFTPAPSNSKTPPKLSYTYQLSDDRKTALVEFISRDKPTLNAIRAAATAPGVKVFDPKIHSKGDVEAEFKRLKKDFDPSRFGRGH
jgi:hypothetical protein